MARQDDIQKLIVNHNRRLQQLKETQALHGANVDPSIPLEIEALEEEIKKLRAELTEWEEIQRSAPATPPGSRPHPAPPAGPPPPNPWQARPAAKPARSNMLLWSLLGSALIILPLLSGLAVYFFLNRGVSPGVNEPQGQSNIQAITVAENTSQVQEKITATAAATAVIEPAPATATPTEQLPAATPTEPPASATLVQIAPTITAPPTATPTETPAPTNLPAPTQQPTPTSKPAIPANPVVDTILNRTPLVVWLSDSAFMCASNNGLNHLLDGVVEGHVIGPYSGDFVWRSRECDQVGNVLFKYVNGSFQLIRQESWERFCNGEAFLPFEEALEMFASGEIEWNGCIGCSGRPVPQCDPFAR